MGNDIPKSEFEGLLNTSSSEEPLPHALPIAHLTTARAFSQIVLDCELRPIQCKVFGEPLLYLFYGGVFYRPRADWSSNAAELPVAFVFGPSILQEIYCYYPFDTGAIQSGAVDEWSERLKPIDRFKVNGSDDMPQRMVRHLFGSNDGYLRGTFRDNRPSEASGMSALYEYMGTKRGVIKLDQRLNKIECHCARPLQLSSNLLWVGLPDVYTEHFAQLCAKLDPYIPQYYIYSGMKAVFNPKEEAAILEREAHEEVIKRYANLPWKIS
jgi:hypothetical protein